MLKFVRLNILCTISLMFFLFLSTIPVYSFEYTSQEERSFIEVYEKTLPSIVSIEADIDHGTSGGTGCIISKSGIILTSSHVVEHSKNITVTTHSGKSYSAKIMAVLKNKNDLALLKIDASEDLALAKFGR